MNKQYLEVEVNYNNEWVNGMVEIDEYIRAIRSLKHTDARKWRSVTVLSPNFTDNIYQKFPIGKIHIIGFKCC